MNLRFPGHEFIRYLAISVVALGVDVALLMLVAQVINYLWAATLGFVVGAAISYFLATRWAFGHRRLQHKPLLEFGGYAMVGIIGLGINNLTIYLAVEMLGVPLLAAKAMAAAASFAFNFGARKLILFSPS